jgi:hypothetical protein
MGMIVAIAVFYDLGYRAIARLKSLRQPIIWGAFAVAIAQIFPIPQMIAGVSALAIARRSGLATEFRPLGTLGGFVVTILTGVHLVIASALIGLLPRAIIRIGQKFPDPNTKRQMKGDDVA